MRLVAVWLFLTALLWPVSMRTEQLYVVYTYNFMQNIQWSDAKKTQPYSLLVLSDNEELKENFQLLADKRTIREHPIKVFFTEERPLNAYSAIFIDTPQLTRYDSIYKNVDGEQTLLISVDESDKQKIMINLLPKGESQYTFEIHRANILNQNLQIGDQLILLGGTEVDVAKLYKKTRKSLEEESHRASELAAQIEIKSAELEATKEKIDAQQTLIRQQSDTIAAQAYEVEQKSATIAALENKIDHAAQQLDRISARVEERTEEVKTQQRKLEQLTEARARKDEEITAQNSILGELKTRIDAHQKSLLDQEKTISEQKDIIWLLAIFSAIIALLAFFLFKLMRENRNHAQRDFLTGLYNRRHFTKMAQKCFNKSGQCDHPLTLAMIDIDNFKPINDTYGHDVGDKAIQSVSSLLQKSLDDHAITGRWGGEEFIALLDLPEEKALELLTRLKDRLPKQKIVPKGHEPFSLTISVGLYTDKGNISLDGMIKAADALLYKAKKEGRDRIVTSL